MTRMASYEKNEGKQDLKKMHFFKMDYVSFNNFKTRFGVTIALLMLFGGDFAIKFINNMATITTFDFVGQFVEYFTIWLAFMVIYSFISAFIYKGKYTQAEKRIEVYEHQLKQLRKMH